MRFVVLFLAMVGVLCGSQLVKADEVKILDAVARPELGLFSDSYLFSVTLEHPDEGWNHFADRWEIWTPDGKTRIGVRVLLHPHVDEQPFTRSLSGVDIPEGITQVLIRAHDLKHADSPHTLLITLPGAK